MPALPMGLETPRNLEDFSASLTKGFFAEDLTHPNKTAIDYVFEKWMETLFDNETKMLFNRIKSIVTDYNHRPFHSETDAHKQFIAHYQERAKQLQHEFPFLNLEEFFFKINTTLK